MRKVFVCGLLLQALSVSAASPDELNETTFQPGKAIVSLGVNWGRTWKCGRYDNAQVQELSFRMAPVGPNKPSLELTTPSRLMVENKFIPYALVLEPGEYVLTAFDVKVARSATDVGHIKGDELNLLKDGKPLGGSFTVAPDKVTYIGHFGLDCGAEPFLWRYYLESRQEFERWIADLRNKFPFTGRLPAEFKLFETRAFGNPFALPGASVLEPQQAVQGNGPALGVR